MTAVVKSVAKMLARAEPLLARLPVARVTVVEVGVSTALLAEHLLMSRSDLSWYGVDPWLGRDEQPASYAATRDVHASLSRASAEANMAMALRRLRHFGERATVYREKSPDAAARFDDASLDLVFVDGDHSYEATLADLRGWWPKIRPGGWLGGHDLKNPDPRFAFGVDKAVEEFAGETGIQYAPDDGCTYWFQKP